MILNDYQQLMLRVADLAPYNAVHSVSTHWSKDDLSQLSGAINKIVQQLTLGLPIFSTDKQSVHFIPLSEPIEVTARVCTLISHITIEMNTPFAVNTLPLRFFVLSSATQSYFAVTYNHWVADAYAIVRLVEAIFLTMANLPLPEPLILQAINPEVYFQKIYGYKVTYYRYIGLCKKILQCSRAYRLPISQIESTESGCLTYFFSQQELSGLRQICQTLQVTLNDLFIALLAKLFGELTQSERQQIRTKLFKLKRNRVMISVISNLRPYSTINLNHIFGMCLGFFSLSFKSPEQETVLQLCQNVAKQTQTLKRRCTAVKQYLLFKIQKRYWDKASTKQSQFRLFSKNIPVMVGISNMHLIDHQWSHTLFSDYTRCSPTAMVCPIVFNITTLNNQMSLAISYRQACYTDEEARVIKDKWIDALRGLMSQTIVF